MEEDILVCVSSPMDIDESLFRAWTKGLGQVEALQIMLRENQFPGFAFRNPQRNIELQSSLSDLIRKDLYDQYRCFDLLDHYLQNPVLLKQQTIVEIKPSLQSVFVEHYWSLDDVFVKEIIMPKKPIKSRKDLDDVSIAIGLNLRRVTRQFENLKRLFVSIEDSRYGWQCNIPGYLLNNFALSSNLSKKYASILFLQVAKFSLTGKKRLQRVSCEVLEHCSALILTCLNTDQDIFYSDCIPEDREGFPQASSLVKGREYREFSIASTSSTAETDLANSSSSTSGVDEFFSVGAEDLCWRRVWGLFWRVESIDIDKHLLANLREIRGLLSGEVLDAGCVHVRAALTAAINSSSQRPLSAPSSPSSTGSQRAVNKPAMKKLLEGSRLRGVVKAILQIGANLSQSREYRDLFEDLLTKVAEPLEEIGLHGADMQLFLVSCTSLLKSVVFPTRNHRSATLTSVDGVRMRTDTVASTYSVTGVPQANSTQSLAESSNKTLDMYGPGGSSGASATGGGGISSSNSSVMPISSSAKSAIDAQVAAATAAAAAAGTQSSSLNRGRLLKRDWVRFVTCCRLCLSELTR